MHVAFLSEYINVGPTFVQSVLINHLYMYPKIYGWTTINLTRVRPLLTLSHRGSDNSPLLIVFSANNIDQSIGYFYATESRLNDFVIFKNNALRLKYAI